MPIKIGTSNAFPYQGDYKPVNVYQGATKLAGWRWATTSGVALAQYQTDYKDTAQVSLEGNSIQPLSFREETGKTLTLTNHEELSLRKLEVSGDSAQNVGSGKNIFNAGHFIDNLISNGVHTSQATLLDVESGYFKYSTVGDMHNYITYLSGKFKPNTAYTMTFEGWIGEGYTDDTVDKVFSSVGFRYTDGSSQTVQVRPTKNSFAITSNPQKTVDRPSLAWAYTGTAYINKLQIEEGSTTTPYEPPVQSPEYPIAINNLSDVGVYSGIEPMSVDTSGIPLDTTTNDTYLTKPTLTAPLRKVGNVADRLFYDKLVGKWKVERRVGEKVLDGTETWLVEQADKSYYTSVSGKVLNKDYLVQPLSSSHFKCINYNKTPLAIGEFRIGAPINGNVVFNYDDLVGGVNNFKTWLSANPVTVQYELATPIIETLPDGTLPPLFKPTTYLDTTSTLKGDIKAGYQLATTATPLETDIKVAPEYVNPIVSVSSVDIVSSVGSRNLLDVQAFKDDFAKNGIPTITIDSLQNSSISYGVISWMERYTTYLENTFKENTSYILSFSGVITNPSDERATNTVGFVYTDNSKDTVLISPQKANFVIKSNPSKVIKKIYFRWAYSGRAVIENFKLEIGGETATPFIPHPRHVLPDTHTPTLYHTQPTLSQPLRRVGDVKDRLFRDADGLWKVERKIWSEVLDGTKDLYTGGASYDGAISTNRWHTTLYEPKANYSDCSHLPWVRFVWGIDKNGGSTANVSKQFHLRIPNYLTGILNSDTTATRSTKMKAYAKAQYDNGTPIVIQYQLATPTLETLPQADQDKLNAIPTYRGDNYVYTVSNVEPSGLKVDYKVRDI